MGNSPRCERVSCWRAPLRQCSFFLVPHLPLADPPCMKVCSTFLCRVGFFYLLSFQVSLFMESNLFTVVCYGHQMEQSPLPHSAPTSSFGGGIFF
jgi:hypothetical protein